MLREVIVVAVKLPLMSISQGLMDRETNRRGLLLAIARSDDRTSIRPPGFHPDRFKELCRDCRSCVDVCTEGIIVTDAKGRAELDFSRGHCTFCGACSESCPTGALQSVYMQDWPWRANITSSCLSLNGVECRSCQDACDERAIGFRLGTGGQAIPKLEADICTGCGSCVASCPVGAIEFETKVQARNLETAT